MHIGERCTLLPDFHLFETAYCYHSTPLDFHAIHSTLLKFDAAGITLLNSYLTWLAPCWVDCSNLHTET
jgi:hypothetical protein